MKLCLKPLTAAPKIHKLLKWRCVESWGFFTETRSLWAKSNSAYGSGQQRSNWAYCLIGIHTAAFFSGIERDDYDLRELKKAKKRDERQGKNILFHFSEASKREPWQQVRDTQRWQTGNKHTPAPESPWPAVIMEAKPHQKRGNGHTHTHTHKHGANRCIIASV